MKTVLRPTRTKAELEDAAGHVVHEMRMLFLITDNYQALASPSEDWIDDMALESFLVHYRNIRDFLFPTSSIKHLSPRYKKIALDTVLALDFNPQGWHYEAKDWREVVGNERERLNKRLSHLSYSRSRYDPQWPLEEMREALASEFNRFLESLPSDKRSLFAGLAPWFPRTLS